MIASGAGFVVYSGLTERPERNWPERVAAEPEAELAVASRQDRALPSALGAPEDGVAREADTPGAAAPRPGGMAAPSASAPALASDSSGFSMSSPSSPQVGRSLTLGEPRSPLSAEAPSAPAPAGPGSAPAPTVDDARSQLAALLGEAPPGDSAPVGPGPAPQAPSAGPDAPEPAVSPEDAKRQLEAMLAGSDEAGSAAPASPSAANGETVAPAPTPSEDDARAQLAALLGETSDTAPSSGSAAPVQQDAAEPPAPDPAPAPVAQPEPAAEPEPVLALAGPALEVNARSIDLKPKSTRIAFVLSDAAGADGLTGAQLSNLPFPVTVGVVPGTDGAKGLASAAREAGHEVLVQLPLEPLDGRVPEQEVIAGDLPKDQIERRTLALLADVPQGVAASTFPATGSGAGGPEAEAIMEVLAQHGFGYLENRKMSGGVAGLAAKRLGVPFIEADRSVARRSTGSQLRQQIDAALADAERSGATIVILPASAETLRILVGWTLEQGGKAQAVPLSVVMKGKSAG